MVLFPFTSIEAYHQHLFQGAVSVAQAVDFYLKQIEKYADLNAFVQVFSEEAQEKALQLDEVLKGYDAQQRSELTEKFPLFGVVVSIKDVICYQDHPVSAASKMLQNYRSPYSATAVQRLLDAGAIVIGSVNCDEFAMGSTNENSWYGPVRNGADPQRVAGGSSGGSAVAVQMHCCMVSLGSDTGGSVRQPADFCGISGFKPTYGRISRYGLIAYASSFDQIGIFAYEVNDISLVLSVIAGPDDFDSTALQDAPPQKLEKATDHPKLRFVYLEETLHHPGLDPEIKTAHLQLIEKLRENGHEVTAKSFPYLEYIVPTYYVLTTAEASSNLSRYDGVRYGYRAPLVAESHAESGVDLLKFYKRNRSEGFGKEVKKRILLGTFVLSEGYFDAYFTKAQQVRRLLLQHTQELFQEYDALIMPTVPSVAFKIGEKIADPIAMYAADVYTVYANLVGIPAISIPLFRHSSGMPFGTQIMTYQKEELSLLRIARYVMEHYSN